MSQSVIVRNSQRARWVNTRVLREMTNVLLRDILCVEAYEISILLAGPAKITKLNEQFLRHAGSTDVITFPYEGNGITGDIVVCVHEAIVQARLFRTNFEVELVRYVIHGLLHLLGYNDETELQRLDMSERENELISALLNIMSLSKLTRRPR